MVNFLATYNRMSSSTISAVFLVKLTFQPMAQYSHKDCFSFSILSLFKSSNCPLKVTLV